MKKTIILFGGVLFVALTAFGQATCSSALPITAGTYVVPGITGTQIPLPVCSANGEGATAGMWYKYTPSSNLSVTVTTDFAINNGVDNRVQIYNGSCSNLVCVAGDDDSGSDYLCEVTFNVIANSDYWIAFDNRWSSVGFTFELIEATPPPAPQISFQSQSFNNVLGQYKYAVADMNGDYLDDIVSISAANIHILYQQLDGTFQAANISVQSAQFLPTWSIAIGDFNKDGFNDLMYGSGSGVSFYKSNSTGTAYSQQSTTNYIFSQRTTFVDINNDGHLDAFACHDVAPNVSFINDGSATLTWSQGGLGDVAVGGHYATIWFDYDNDGDVDMFISKCSGGGQGLTARFNEMHRNNGDGTYTNVSVEANMNHGNQTWSSAVNDFDNDGFMDVIVGVSNFQNDGTHLYMHNNGDGTFTDIALGSGWDTYAGSSIEFVSFDFDNDGWADVFTNQGNQGRIFRNNGNNTFTNLAVSPNFGAVGDLNNDGFLDIQNGTTVFFNEPNGNNWSKINLKGIESNSNGIGSRVEIYGAWGKQIRDVQSGVGFRHMSSLNPHFGIGQATEIDSIIIRWPSGKVDLICNPNINTTIFIEEGSGIVPVSAFTESSTSVTAGDIVTFSDASTLCPSNWTWTVDQSTGWTFANGTNANSQNPEIQFTNYGWYNVSLVASNANGPSENTPSVQVFVESGAGLENSELDKLVLFPNPTEESLRVQFSGSAVGATSKIRSTIGAEVMSFENIPSHIDVALLKSGTYFLVIELSNGKNLTKLFVKK
jgi:hypothetical protein